MALLKCKECGGQVSSDAKTCPHCGTKKFIKKPIGKIVSISAAFWIFVVLVSALSDKKSNSGRSVAESTPAQKKVELERETASPEAKASGQCMSDISKMKYLVVNQIDKTHYWLESQSNHTGSGHMEMETNRNLPIGKTVNFSEATFLGTKGDFSNLTVLWREGCTTKDKAAADYSQGTWWTPIDPSNPNGPRCVKAITTKYNVAPSTMIKASEGTCVISDGSSPFSLLFLDCTKSALGVKITYTRTRQQCLTFVSITEEHN